MFGMSKNKRDKEFSSDMLLKEDAPFLMREDYRTTCTNIMFSFPEEGSKVIAVTSANKSEGKSTNAINLAFSFAQMGKSVLLIDCDLRRPSIAAKLNTKQRQGLSNMFVESGDTSSYIKILKMNNANVFLLFAGTIPPDPTRLLGSKKMGEIINRYKSKFDIIVLDCPPVNSVVDASLIAPYVDGYALVVRHNTTEYEDIDMMITQLKRVNANILGFIYHDLPVNYHQKDKKYYYYYGKDE